MKLHLLTATYAYCTCLAAPRSPTRGLCDLSPAERGVQLVRTMHKFRELYDGDLRKTVYSETSGWFEDKYGRMMSYAVRISVVLLLRW